jgi:hypothetical protein
MVSLDQYIVKHFGMLPVLEVYTDIPPAYIDVDRLLLVRLATHHIAVDHVVMSAVVIEGHWGLDQIFSAPMQTMLSRTQV